MDSKQEGLNSAVFSLLIFLELNFGAVFFTLGGGSNPGLCSDNLMS